MRLATKVLLKINGLFKPVVHPFNLRNEGKKSYARWQYEKGEQTIAFYLKKYSLDDMFGGKVVADIGCGAAGKSLYYASCGAKKVIGAEILKKYREEADQLACELGLKEKFEFVPADAAQLPFEDNAIDTIIMNDAAEHVDQPEAVLAECLRVLKKGGRLYINFPPYHHPFGAHLSDAIHIPWVHLFFGEQTLIEAYKYLVDGLPDGKDRIAFRLSQRPDGSAYFSYINKMTVKRFKKILDELQITPAYYKEEPLRNVLRPLCSVPILKEGFVKMVVCVIEKQ